MCVCVLYTCLGCKLLVQRDVEFALYSRSKYKLGKVLKLHYRFLIYELVARVDLFFLTPVRGETPKEYAEEKNRAEELKLSYTACSQETCFFN